MTRIYVPLSKDMSDEEIVQAFNDAAAKLDAQEAAEEDTGVAETPTDEASNE